jgi:hypothetical protein
MMNLDTNKFAEHRGWEGSTLALYLGDLDLKFQPTDQLSSGLLEISSCSPANARIVPQIRL